LFLWFLDWHRMVRIFLTAFLSEPRSDHFTWNWRLSLCFFDKPVSIHGRGNWRSAKDFIEKSLEFEITNKSTMSESAAGGSELGFIRNWRSDNQGTSSEHQIESALKLTVQFHGR
jgi:hypothetical protein